VFQLSALAVADTLINKISPRKNKSKFFCKWLLRFFTQLLRRSHTHFAPLVAQQASLIVKSIKTKPQNPNDMHHKGTTPHSHTPTTNPLTKSIKKPG
jgi:hypothetical protein